MPCKIEYYAHYYCLGNCLCCQSIASKIICYRFVGDIGGFGRAQQRFHKNLQPQLKQTNQTGKFKSHVTWIVDSGSNNITLLCSLKSINFSVIHHRRHIFSWSKMLLTISRFWDSGKQSQKIKVTSKSFSSYQR